MKQKLKQIVKWSAGKLPLLSMCLLVAIALDYSIIKTTMFVLDPVPYGEFAVVNVARAEVEPEMPLKLWALNYAYEQGIDVEKFECVLKNESNWDNNKWHVNKNGSVDFAIAMWNSQHIKSGYISLKCAADPKCAITKMIEKVKKDGSFKAWLAVSKCK